MVSLFVACVGSAVGFAAQVQPPLEEIYQPGASAHWRVEQGERVLGWHAQRYLGSAPAPELPGGRVHCFRGWLDLESPQPPALGRMRSTADLWVDGRGAVRRFLQQVELGDARVRLTVQFEGGAARAAIEQGGSLREVEVEAAQPLWLLANNFVGHLELALALHACEGPVEFPLYSAATLRPVPFRARPEPSESGANAAGVRRLLDDFGQRLVLRGRELWELDVPAAGVRFVRTETPFEEFLLSPPTALAMGGDFELEEVRLLHEDLQLAGVLTRPTGTETRLPGVLFLSGSGAQDRHGFAAGLDLGTHEILDHLTNLGAAVLRLDDRGAGASSAPPAEPSIGESVRDLGIAMDFLAGHPWVDPGRIWLVGHSEGALLAPLLAEVRADVAGLVLLAAPGRPLHELMLDQNRDVLAASGLTGDALEAALAELRRGFLALISAEVTDPASLPSSVAPLWPLRRWLSEHATVQLAPAVARLAVPTYLAQGTLDFQVSLERDARPLYRAIVEAGHPDVTLGEFAGLDHLFKAVPGERSEWIHYTQKRPVDPGFLRALSEWLKPRWKPAGAPADPAVPTPR